MSIKENKKGYIPSIDGLRALAIILVLAYHFQVPFFQGGFIGVDIFFVLSGYLITSSLLVEWQKSKQIDVKKFWLKRLKRLLPSVLVMLFVVLICCYFIFPSSFKKSWPDSIAAFFYVSNWWYIFQKIPYFDSFGTPSPFKHLWSLAIEEQFYLVWPVLLFSLLKWLKKRQHVLKCIIVLGVASAFFMGIIYSPGAIDRVYYGTDTRLFTVLAGCALGFIWPYYYLEDNISKKSQLILDGIGGTTLAGLLFLAITLNEFQVLLYRGGFLLVAILAVILLAVIIHPSSRLGSYFAHPYLQWIGKRSYGIYLWHYPIVALTTPIKLIGLFNPLLVSFQLLLSLVIAEFSYRWIEEPIRQKGVKGFYQELKHFKLETFVNPLLHLALIILISGGLASVFIVNNKVESKPIDTVKKVKQPSQTTEESQTVAKEKVTKVLAIGDSILLGIQAHFEATLPGVVVDGKVGRQLVDAEHIIEEKYREFNREDAVIIVELGSNSPFEQKNLTSFLSKVEKAKLIIINTRVPRNWEREVNSLLADATENQPNRILIDWYSVASSTPQLLGEDGVHLSDEGVAVYTELIMDELATFDLEIKP